MNRFESFFSQLTLISFRGGAMGSFFINFLMAADEENYKELYNKHRFGETPNLEWYLAHYFEYIRVIDEETLNELKSYYGEKSYIQPTFFAAGHIFQDLYKSRILTDENVKKIFTFDKVLELSKKDFGPVLLPYIKNHELENQLTLSANNPVIPYQKKIFCHFPVKKQWMILLLVLYKHHLYKVFNDASIHEYDSTDLKNILDAYDSNTVVKSASPLKIEGHESIDMYELVFNKNFDGLRAIYPGYEPNNLQLELLDKAHNSSKIILDRLKLSHEISILGYRTKDFLDQTGLIDIINAYLELEKNKL